ncbi:trigger factor [Flavobacteriaceae bacterium]|nr:trigger factor [Flavobacteriaceae bacterium]MDB4025479.1 trigger factor [Flavobacteriaceae bacterium]MDB4236773.1 trigger factor [Flavobacteriaceae bacterium]MDB9781343.1 trigger factor [Flavobacteriaceae bacterium]
MNITKENIDALNAVIKVAIVADDYRAKVDQMLSDYRKKADIPGFRKGHVPMGMIKKQYEKSIMIDEVNKLLQDSLNKFLTEEKIDILGNPIPKIEKDFSWDSEVFSFDFELGLAPQFEVDLTSKKKVTQYVISADDALIDKEVENLQSRYGKMSAVDVIKDKTNVTGTFVNEEQQIENKSTINLSDLKGKANLKKFVGNKVGDVIELKTKGLFSDDHKLEGALGLSNDQIHGLDIKVSFTIEETTEIELADLDQELFDKLFTDGSVKTVSELRKKIQEDAEKQFQQQADQQLLNSVTEYLIDNTSFDLPSAFLQKWLATAGEKELTPEQAVEEYNKSEKGLRYQLIQEKIIKDNDIKLDYEELKEYAKGFIRSQMAQFGNMNPEDAELDDIANRILTNQEEAKKLQDQLLSQKLMTFYKEKMTFKTKKVTYEGFIKEVYK